MLSWVTRRPGDRRSTSAPVIIRAASILRTDRRLLPGYREVERSEAIARERPRARVLECATPKFTDGATLAARTRCSLTIVRRASRRNPGW